MKHNKFTFLIAFLLFSLRAFSQFAVSFPPERIVFQRNKEDFGYIYITGTFTSPIDRVEARATSRAGESGTSIGWTTIATNPVSGVFSGNIGLKGGRYDLEVRGLKNDVQVGAIQFISKVGIGEVFYIVGHSNASGGSDLSPSLGATSDQVSSINPNTNKPLWDQYWLTANPDNLPPLQFSQLCQTCGMSPSADIPWFWSQLGDKLVNALGVPVLFYSAAFGGSNIEYFYKSAYDIPFEHSFIKYDLRMPYANVRNGMNRFVPRTGLRGVLSGHGVNDIKGNDEEGTNFKFNNGKVIEKSRSEAGYQDLAWMIAIACRNNDGVSSRIAQAQNEMVDLSNNIFKGADLNSIERYGTVMENGVPKDVEFRYDGLHFSTYGQAAAAQKWFEAITSTSPNFLSESEPLMASAPPLPESPLPVTLLKFEGQNLANGRNRLTWTTTMERNNDHFEVERGYNGISFEKIGEVAGVGNSTMVSNYNFTDEILAPVAYYRLKQVDLDGQFEYSRIIAVHGDAEDKNAYIYPNPVRDMLEVKGFQSGTLKSLKILDVSSTAVLQSADTEKINVSSLVPGHYFIEIKNEKGNTVVRKFVKY
ncbi:hypothetical protein DYBT9275_01013 [Dyadobacter sp. CECT 9275]|uniref:Secretion system C-terminal sorting domain-containing protein n=1 Tax=Dyadobacter helix TaxID=2822344 RepID=A0A916N4N6_9BACT|nr:T9SS type A sorting domain-containing protein [Dyadobacter sp. CECT 9275]CAG4992688.1 hypothetical protein DYBT9275_01013 [Dyadobacter sp. CECT 9275]